MRASKAGRSGGHAGTLADLKRLRKKSEAAASPPSPPGGGAGAIPAPNQSPARRTRQPVESLAAAKLDEAALSRERAPARSTRLSQQFAGLGRMLSSARESAGPCAADAPKGAQTRMPDANARAGAPAPAITAQDQALFRRAVKSAQPIKDTRRAILPPPPRASGAVLRERRERAVGAEPGRPPQTSDQYSPAGIDHDGASFVRRGHGPDLAKGLKRGKWPIGASLDLHGNTLEEARDRLDHFLQSCLTHQIKCVRIVHGKGYGSKDGEPVLKQTVRRWLTQMADVLAYAECPEQDGGSGAVQVLLRTGRP
ncbi:Smr/MutS family protein [Pollutimonas bauzanensis]|uniref:DNA-nicking endonuclease, Smr domain n=1 Tax=Pollutimonas bauzanensis TaxID=658167 RepID=A0A1M5YY97_9BURK|nr:Smr/MutS family protein [Pollutimonas bauzanensis]SHI16513.1 DNA-nicking endonuclease, Smr domain [Pollutimonas bauzanensis]